MASTFFTPPHVYEQPFPAFDINAIKTPAYVVDVALLGRTWKSSPTCRVNPVPASSSR